VGYFNPLLSPEGRFSRQKINKEKFRIKRHFRSNGLKDIYRLFHPIETE
jgi:hypothetical protein